MSLHTDTVNITVAVFYCSLKCLASSYILYVLLVHIKYICIHYADLIKLIWRLGMPACTKFCTSIYWYQKSTEKLNGHNYHLSWNLLYYQKEKRKFIFCGNYSFLVKVMVRKKFYKSDWLKMMWDLNALVSLNTCISVVFLFGI